MTLLTMCQQVADEIGIPSFTSVIGNNSTAAKSLLAAAQVEGRVLAKGLRPDGRGRHNWSLLRKEQTFSTANGTASYALTAAGIITDGDFERFVPETWWDRTNTRPLRLVDAQEWQILKSSLTASSGIDSSIIQRGTSIYIDPTPSDIRTLVFEYISTHWCQTTGGGATKAAWSVDTDVGILPEHLMGLGVKWRYLRRNGEPYADEKEEYDREVTLAMGEDGGNTIARRNMLSDAQRLADYNIPDTNYG